MSETVISVENLSKAYRLGVINHGMLYKDLQSWWARFRGKEDPNSVIGMYNQEQIDGDDRFWALRDINFQVKQGDRVGIIGKNGAGKSTLLKILSRVTAPTKGNVRVKGRIASLLEVGTGFHPELTGRENVFLNGAILGMSKQEITKKFDEIVDFAGIGKFIDTPVKRYSSGMYVRLAFAVAAHLEPEILVVDEVLAVGDAEFQKKAIGKMEDVSKGEGRTILFVSHNMAAIKGLCNDCLLIETGKITMFDNVDKVISKYNSNNSIIGGNRDFSKRKTVNLPLKFISMDVFNGDFMEVESIPCGSKVIFDVKFQIIPDEIKNIRIGISFYNSINGSYVTEFNSYYLRNEMVTCKQGVNRCLFGIDKMPLSPGGYTVNLIATRELDVLDWIRDACQIVIGDGLFYKTERMPLPGSYPAFFTECDVEFK